MSMMEDVDGDSFHGTRESYSYSSDVEWSAIGRMSWTVGEEDVWAMISSRDRDQPHSVIKKFLRRELDESQADVTSLLQQDH